MRRRDPEPDEVRFHLVERCPECGRHLQEGWEHARRQVIEVICQPWVTEHVVMRSWCGVCRKQWIPKLEPGALGVQGKRRFGASVQALAALLHIQCRVPIRAVQEFFREVGEISISTGEIVALLEGVRAAGEPALAEIKARVRQAKWASGDETGWREDGENGYLWGFFTERERYFEYRKSRAGRVPEEILGKDFGGIVSCDFYGGYNKFDRLQRCWVHLLRDAKTLAERNADRPEVLAWVEALKTLYREAKDFSARSPRRRRRARAACEQRAEALARPYGQDPEAPQRVLSQGILKHLGELFVFVEHPEVPSDNNLAERSLRPAVIARKVSGGTRSPKGSQTWTGLRSLFSTWRARGQPLLRSCRELLLPTPVP